MSKITKENFMAKFQEIVDKAKDHFNLEADEHEGMEEAMDAPLMTSYMAKDGTIILVEGELIEGSKVEIQKAEGDEVAPDGSYELETGEIITVVEGVITAVEASPLGEDASIDMEAVEAKFSSMMEAKIEVALAKQKLELTKEFQAKFGAVLSALESSGELMAKFADTPITDEEEVPSVKGSKIQRSASSALGKLGQKR
jgi:hypothetical protein